MKKYKMTKKQKAAHSASEKYILYGGAVGGGKSAWLVNECNLHCLKYPGARVFLCRHQLTSLRKTTLLTLEEWLPTEYIEQHHKTQHYFRYRNGSMLFYGGLGDDIKAIEKLKSMELSAYAIDQAEESEEQFFFMLNSRLRLKLKNIQYKAWLTANPTSNWVRTRFVESSLEDHVFIPALPGDNPHLPSTYVADLLKVLPVEIAEAWLGGSWDSIQEENNLFSYNDIRAAMERSGDDGGPVCIGCDVARFGHDETVIAMKRGNVLTFEKIMARKDTMTTTGEIIKTARGDKNIPLKIDSIGVGAGVADRLAEQKYNMREIVASAKATQNTVYKNKRAEDYFSFKNLLPTLRIPDDEKLAAQMMAIRYRIFSDGLLLIESKAELKRRGQSSPDRLDALVIVCSGEGGEELVPDKSWTVFTGTPQTEIDAEKPRAQYRHVPHPVFSTAAEQKQRIEMGRQDAIEATAKGIKPTAPVEMTAEQREQKARAVREAEKRTEEETDWIVGSSGGGRAKPGDSRLA